MTDLTQEQVGALRAAYDALDRLAVAQHGPDTPVLLAARTVREQLRAAFPLAFAGDSPIVTPSG